LFNKEKLKTIFHQNWIELTRRAQFDNEINNAPLNNIYQVSPIVSISGTTVTVTQVAEYFQSPPVASCLKSTVFATSPITSSIIAYAHKYLQKIAAKT
jgi:hypothetical protein